MNRSIHNLINDIFSNEHGLDFFINCIDKEECDTTDKECQSEPWLRRLEQFYDDFLKTEEGLDYKRWLPVAYDKQYFIEEYTTWFYFFHYFQKKIKAVGNRILFKRLLFFQPLFLTKPFIFYIKRILKLNYFYTYFVDLSKPSVYSLFKELEKFICYFPWYSGFTILDHYGLKSGIDKSNDHMQQYINNLVDYKELYDIHDSDKLLLLQFVRFIDFTDYAEKEVKPGDIKEILGKQIKKKIKPEELLFSVQMDRLACKKASPFRKSKYYGRISVSEDLLISICVNFCLQDILDKLVEDLREQELPEIKSHFTIQKFDEIKKKNPYMRRFARNNYEDGYYFSPQIDLFGLVKVLEDLKVMNNEQKRNKLKQLFLYFIANNRDGNRNKIINFLYKKHKDELKTTTSTINILKLLTDTIENNREISAKDIEDDEGWIKIQKFLQDNDILYEVTENFGNLLVHIAFRKDIPKQFSNFDYCFIGLKLSNLRYILRKTDEYTDSSLMFYEMHQIAAFKPLEDYEERIAQKRLQKVKNFFSSFIYIFATRIVSDKMSHFVEQKTASDVTSRWAHALKTRIEFLKPIARSLKEKFLSYEPYEKRERNIVNILENRVRELSNVASLVYELSKERIENPNISKGFKEFARRYKENPKGCKGRHLVEIIQESIKTALVRIITDDVYSTYIAARGKCIKPEYFTKMEIPKSKLGSKNMAIEIDPENQDRLILGARGLSNIDQSTIETFLDDIYRITTLDNILTIEYRSDDVQENLNYFILEESILSETDKRFPMATMISLLFDELLLNALKYFDKNIDGLRFVKIDIWSPKVGFSDSNEDNSYILPITIKNSIGPEIKKELIQRDTKKYRTGLQLIEMGLSLLQEESRDKYFKMENGRFFEFKLNIPVYLSGSNWTQEYQSKIKEVT